MSWLRNLFRSAPVATTAPTAPHHVGILVCGTLFNANMGATELKMRGMDGAPHVRGVAPVFGIGDELQAEWREHQWKPLRQLEPPWLFVIPEAAYAEFSHAFHGAVGRMIDGRRPQSSPFNISGAAHDELIRIIADWGPAPERPPPAPSRVAVGTCFSCGRELKVKAGAVRPTMKLTCKCGAANVVECVAATPAEAIIPD